MSRPYIDPRLVAFALILLMVLVMIVGNNLAEIYQREADAKQADTDTCES